MSGASLTFGVVLEQQVQVAQLAVSLGLDADAGVGRRRGRGGGGDGGGGGGGGEGGRRGRGGGGAVGGGGRGGRGQLPQQDAAHTQGVVVGILPDDVLQEGGVGAGQGEVLLLDDGRGEGTLLAITAILCVVIVVGVVVIVVIAAALVVVVGVDDEGLQVTHGLQHQRPLLAVPRLVQLHEPELPTVREITTETGSVNGNTWPNYQFCPALLLMHF